MFYEAFAYISVHKGDSLCLFSESLEFMDLALVILKDTVDGLLTGNIKVQKLELLQDNKQTFIELCKILLEQKNPVLDVPESGLNGIDKVQVIIKVLNWRKEEMDKFRHTRTLVNHLVTMCKQIEPGQLLYVLDG